MSEFQRPPVEEVAFSVNSALKPQLRTVEPENVIVHEFAPIIPFPQPSAEASIIEVRPEPFYWYKQAEAPKLSPFHREILTLTAEGYPGHMIAKETKKSEQTVKNNRLFLQRALRAQTMPEAVAIALANGLIVVPDAAAQLGQLRELTKEEYDLYVLAAEHPGEAVSGEGKATFAARVGSAPTTVTNHLTPVYSKLGIRCREQLVTVRFAELQQEIESGESSYGVVQEIEANFKKHLTRQEQSVLHGMREGLTNAQIAARLGVKVHTVINYVAHVFDFFEVSTRQEAVAAAYGEYSLHEFYPPRDMTISGGEERLRELLTPRDIARFELVMLGMTTKEISEREKVKRSTIEMSLVSARRRMGARNPTHAILMLIHNGILDPKPLFRPEQGDVFKAVEKNSRPGSLGLAKSEIIPTRTLEVLDLLVADGGTARENSEISTALGVTRDVVKDCFHRLHGELGVSSRMQVAVLYDAYKRGVLPKHEKEQL